MYDHSLGLKIQNLLQQQKLENPVDFSKILQWQDPGYLSELESAFAAFIAKLGVNITPEEQSKTAKRISHFYTAERFWGLDYAKFPQINRLENEFSYHQPLIARDIYLNSTCEHHYVAITGKVLIAYIPDQYMVGLNKLNQVVEFFAKRPQLQERLTRQLVVVLQELLSTSDVAVVINARHDCMESGGIKDSSTQHTTYQLGGTFSHDVALKALILGAL